MVTSIETWWNDHVIAPIQNAISALREWLGIDANKTATLTITEVHVSSSGEEHGGGEGQGFATGLDYVPYNDYVARLHEGEAVLTKAEASLWRRRYDEVAASIDYDRLASVIASSLSGMSVQMDGQAVGVLVTGAVSREMGRRVKARQYTG